MAGQEFDEGYTYKGARGWRRYRMLRPGWGMYHDIKRRFPFYWSDIRDAWTYRTVASIIRIYFVNLLPAVAYQLDMYRRTGEFYGINEALFASALAAVVFSIFAAQPLTIVGITGLISLFNYTTFDIIQMHAPEWYPQFMAWVGIWAAILHWLTALWNWCDYMRYVTDFSSDSFGLYVGIIYMIKGVEELVYQFRDPESSRSAGFLSCLIAILYFGSVYFLEKLGAGTVWNAFVRGLFADYAFPIATLFWVGFAHIPGELKDTDVAWVPITRTFHPTQPRNWVIDFWNLPVKWVFVALPFAFLLTLLFYYDHNVSSLTAQARNFPLKKPGGFHWDFFLLGVTTFISGILGLPMPNGLVPQAPVHTDSLTNYKTVVEVFSASESENPEIRRSAVKAVTVVEQRISHFIMALALIGTMTGPLLRVLHTMPVAVFSGVFFVVGWGSIETNGIVEKLLFLMKEGRFIQRNHPLLQVPKTKICLYIGIQIFGVACSVAISQTVAAIGFPVIITALIPIRTRIMPKLFTQHELEIMDDLTANNEAVLASLGGEPKLLAGRKSEDYGLEHKYSEKSRGSMRQRAGSIHR
ncbi:HCO3 transporter family protein [Eremomyces bilateralis CBS 781.70]|uniref:HCO3 transporter family protein n=1 Tax=Eremomyces bilateralis CBS 781.70 TaxID=1392243 RepID=A0A6G1G0L7_9PEZI|nr:HCO3 transporter family protein [Eremomyces bilateralis CBS 781.70]KAF1811655.1 HCO3 transporter family protein [Eremomyces bilateralis CBS 781.70]